MSEWDSPLDSFLFIPSLIHSLIDSHSPLTAMSLTDMPNPGEIANTQPYHAPVGIELLANPAFDFANAKRSATHRRHIH